jgi:glycosyltransferase involved in cell wall biosynthesis
MMSSPLVSVIVPAYNAERFLGDAIQSIHGQNYPSIQLIVVDDGSTDKTAEIAQRFGNQIEYVFQQNAGPAAARNRGIALARGEFIAFLDADDLWTTGKLTDQVAFLLRDLECDVILGRMRHEWLEGAEEPDPLYEAPIITVNVGMGLYRRKVFDLVGRFDESLRFAEDHDWFLRAREAAISMKVLDQVVLVYRRHGGNMTVDRKAARLPITGVLQRSLERRRQKASGKANVLPAWNDMDKARCPLVTVVVPAFNGRRSIAAALRSVWKQNYRPIDVIVVDDGSTDDTEVVAGTVPHVKVIRQQHMGMAAACNAGIEAARSELIAFLNQDCLWLPSKLRTQVDVLLADTDLGFVHCAEDPLLESGYAGAGVPSAIRSRDLGRSAISGFVFRKPALQQVGLFASNPPHEAGEDWLSRATKAQIAMKFLPEALFKRQILEGDVAHEHTQGGDVGGVAMQTGAHP